MKCLDLLPLTTEHKVKASPQHQLQSVPLPYPCHPIPIPFLPFRTHRPEYFPLFSVQMTYTWKKCPRALPWRDIYRNYLFLLGFCIAVLVRACINSSIVVPSRVACTFAKVRETIKGSTVKTSKIYSFGETQNSASQMYFCINLETIDILFNLSDTTVAFVLC